MSGLLRTILQETMTTLMSGRRSMDQSRLQIRQAIYAYGSQRAWWSWQNPGLLKSIISENQRRRQRGMIKLGENWALQKRSRNPRSPWFQGDRPRHVQFLDGQRMFGRPRYSTRKAIIVPFFQCLFLPERRRRHQNPNHAQNLQRHALNVRNIQSQFCTIYGYQMKTIN